jgi:hypothetical protein
MVRNPIESLQELSWGIPALLRFELEDGLAVAEFGADLVAVAHSVPDEKSGDEQEDKSEEKNGEWCERELKHNNPLSSRR